MILIESTSGTGNDTWSYSGTQTPNTFSFANDGDADATVGVGSQTITVKPGEAVDIAVATPFYELAITATGAWRLLVGR